MVVITMLCPYFSFQSVIVVICHYFVGRDGAFGGEKGSSFNVNRKFGSGGGAHAASEKNWPYPVFALFRKDIYSVGQIT